MDKKIRLAMIIDDEIIDQRQYCRTMKKSGLVEEVMTFTYADEALDYLLKNPERAVDVIFLDINMPRMNGFEFLENVTAKIGPEFAKIVVVMLTTSLNPDDQQRAGDFAVVKEYITKPLTLAHLHKVIGYL